MSTTSRQYSETEVLKRITKEKNRLCVIFLAVILTVAGVAFFTVRFADRLLEKQDKQIKDLTTTNQVSHPKQ
ncbi:MAG: hypothetical protein A3C06_00385 [Candidatus Taylorbacteria bacterium RIFCSPHIGHO2_02_FULL_46_13]|uniref:Uncharacterized protein n=1 Tax=Candidatus Taylorbacteria bacterium RIFCSPHIGHO2_02_FULL_46_13 TaxID=1802312 RepID=A0A1G2MPU8_9BACT|nr:MAG: hypothetical protein A3C06_00385 [Candidatus Taylorbacteria bacterium RIFCSPHIGHO2_02_FULL_46_13]